jgi:hypothetical protein
MASSVALSIALVAVVEHQDARVGEKSPRDRDPLSLSARERHPALPDLGCVAVAESATMKSCACASRAATSMDACVASQAAEGDVLFQRPREQEHILLDRPTSASAAIPGSNRARRPRPPTRAPHPHRRCG